MSFSRQLMDSPENFLQNNGEESVKIALTEMAYNVGKFADHESLCILAKCLKLYPQHWLYVIDSLDSKYPPFLSLLKSGEPMSKKRKVDCLSDEQNIIEACHVFAVTDRFFHKLWPWNELVDLLPNLSNEKSKWFAIETLGEVCNVGEKTKSVIYKSLSSKNNLNNALENIELKVMLCQKDSAMLDNCDTVNIPETLQAIENVLLPKSAHNSSSSTFITLNTPRRKDILKEIALSISERKSVFLVGPFGCGKTKLVEHFMNVTGHKELIDFNRIAMNDQIDGKTLIGSYSCQEVPGQFTWINGLITRTALNGGWLLIEDVDQAPPEVLAILEPMIQKRELHILSRGEIHQMHPAFQLFLTSRNHIQDIAKLRISKLTTQLNMIEIPQWSQDELNILTTSLYPNLNLELPKMIAYFWKLQSLQSSHQESRQKPCTIRDLIKWCQRLSSTKSDLTPEDFVLEGMDCFCAHLGKAGSDNGQDLSHLFNLTENGFEHLKNRQSNIVEVKESVLIGRVKLSKSCSKVVEIGRPYCITDPASRLLEFIAMCIKNKEPVLLVGETGVGKTSAIQFLAEKTGHQLVAVNLNQQTESCDLIGGIKPVNVEHYVNPIYDEFLNMFGKTFNSQQNAKFLAHLSNCRSSQRWKILVELMLRSSEKIKNDEEWTKLHQKIEQVYRAVCANSKLYFAFIHGVLITAVTQGQWILLDEINMAEADVLDCIAEILNPDIHEISVQGNDGQTVAKHSNFRVFGCMNPSTDVGKKDLNGIIRTRFTEYFIEEPYSKNDLQTIVQDYLKNLDVDKKLVSKIVSFYLLVRKEAKKSLIDGTGHQPTFSLRTLCRALNVSSKNPCQNPTRSIIEAFLLCFLTELDRASYDVVFSLITKYLGGANVLKRPLPCQPGEDQTSIQIEGYWISCGTKPPQVPKDYILTPSVRKNLKDVSRIVSLSNFAVLLQGETSVGKTSMITYLADATGNTCIRINNHEHTDVQEYLGSYVVNDEGTFVFQEGVLPLAMRNGFWVILDELNLAPTDVLEALNRVLDDNRELFIPETQTLIKAHPNFRLFATQNPTGTYGGRKPLSRAFRNRFVELHFSEVPTEELSEIIEKRAGIARSQSVKLVQVLKKLQMIRRQSATFQGKHSFLTLRDLFRWAFRCSLFKETGQFIYDWEQHFAEEGYLVLTCRSRSSNGTEESIVKEVLEEVFKRKVDLDKILYGKYMHRELKLIESNPVLKDMVWTSSAKRLALMILHSFYFNEPVLLVGETGCGKTRICQTIASVLNRELVIVNCHLNTESSDFLGSLRPCRDLSQEDHKPFQWVDGPLVNAMDQGSILLIDEISLAEDGVLERLNSVLESSRSLYLMEQCDLSGEIGGGVRQVTAHQHFQIVATMNPGGDYGKRELSPALRNRLVEIWCPSVASREDLIALMELHIGIENTKVISEAVLDFVKWYDDQQVCVKVPFTIRDLVAWMTFIKDSWSNIGLWCSVIHGVCLVMMDGIANFLRDQSLQDFQSEAENLFKKYHSDCHWISSRKICDVNDTMESLKIGVFSIPKNPEAKMTKFEFHSETVAKNAMKILRGLQLKTSTALLLEGSPGVGKSSIVSAIASLTGNTLVRINLSEQTEISDLIGSDLPSSNSDSMYFEWNDGPLLAALKAGHWILLDELNLATQSVLEGLNACLDHRAEIYIPELNRTFSIESKKTRIFATQNPPREGGERKHLPKSFLNRFVKIHMSEYTLQDIKQVCQSRFGDYLNDEILNKIVMTLELFKHSLEQRRFGGYGSPWQFNLRDLIRLCQGITNDHSNFYKYLHLIFVQRFRTSSDQTFAMEILKEIFGGQTITNIIDNYDDLVLDLTETELKIGQAKLPRINQQGPRANCQLYLQDYPILEKLAFCINANWLSILVGSGKTEDLSRLVQIIGGLTGQTLHCLTLNSATDTSELLGGFEQTSHDLILSKLKSEIRNSITKDIQNDDQQKHSMESLLKLIKIKLRLNECTDFNSLRVILDEYGKINPNIETIKQSVTHEIQNKKLCFEWIDSVLVKAMENGEWVVLTDANLCNPSVLDRLNSLMEENGSLAIGEKGCHDGQIPQVRPHPNFKLFLTMDPRDGELSPAMRNRGVEIFVPELDQNRDTINGNELIQFGRSFIISRQFHLTKNNFASSMGQRAWMAFFSLVQDWSAREYLFQISQKNSALQHPCRSYLEEITKQNNEFVADEFKIMAILERDCMKSVMNQIPKKFKQIKHGLDQFIRDLTVEQDWSKLNFIGNVIHEMTLDLFNQDKLAILWEHLSSNTFATNFLLDELLLMPINKFENMALKFSENYFKACQHPQMTSNYYSFNEWIRIRTLDDLKLKPLEMIKSVLLNILKQDLFCQSPNDLKITQKIMDAISTEKIVGLISKHFQPDDDLAVQNYDNLLTLYRCSKFQTQKVMIQDGKDIILNLDGISKALEQNKTKFTEKTQSRESKVGNYAREILSTFSESLQNLTKEAVSSLPIMMSETVRKMISNITTSAANTVDPKNQLLNLITCGLTIVHIVGERSDIDISDKFKIICEIHNNHIQSLSKDIQAYDSCRALFVIESSHEYVSKIPIQQARNCQIQNLEKETEILQNQIRHRNPNDSSYLELVTEIKQVKNSLLSVETVQDLIEGITKSENALSKIQSWTKSVTSFISQLPPKFQSYFDVWSPFLFGCSVVILGLMEYKNHCSRFWRTGVMDKYDDLRGLLGLNLNCDHIFKSRDIFMTAGNNVVSNNYISEENLFETLKNDTLLSQEKILVYQAFSDSIAQDKSMLNNAYVPLSDLEKILKNMITFVKEAFEVPEDVENNDDLNPFVSEVLTSLQLCLSRSVIGLEPQNNRFLVPLEGIVTKIKDWNKHAVSHKIIPLKDLQSLLISWRKQSHQWSKIESRIRDHLEMGVDICLNSLKPFLSKAHKKVEALVVPFLLFCHNGFIGDFTTRLNKLNEIIDLIQYDELKISRHLNTVLAFYSNFFDQLREKRQKANKELKMKFDVQIKANKRLYEDTNLDNHFKAANAIVRESTSKFEELSLCYARNYFKMSKSSLTLEILELSEEAFEEMIDDESISEEIQIPKNRFSKKVSQCLNRLKNQDWENIHSWQEDAENLRDELSQAGPKKLTFHVVKTKTQTGVVAHLKDMGLTKDFGSRRDIQMFKVLQLLPVSKESKKCTKPLFKHLLVFDQLSSSLLLPTKSKSKSFAFCRQSQDLVSHGTLLEIKLLRQIIFDLEQANLTRKVVEKLDIYRKDNIINTTLDNEDLAEIYSKAKWCLDFTKSKLSHVSTVSQIQDLLKLTMDHSQSKKIRENDLKNFLVKIDHQLNNNTEFHPSLSLRIRELRETLANLTKKFNTPPNSDVVVTPSRLQEKFNQNIRNEVKIRCLIIQTVIKRLQQSQNLQFVPMTNEIVDILKILDIESFQIAMTSLEFMKKEYPGLDLAVYKLHYLIFQHYLWLWKAVFNLAWNLHEKYGSFFCSTTEALKKVLEYDYMESKDDEQDDDENAQAQDDGKTQEGCGLGDGEAGQATTSDVTSEDMFDSAEKPKPNEDDQDQNQSEDQKDEQMPPKEEDGFDVDNVQDENPQEKEDEGNEQNSDEENDDKNDELDAEEGKADENIDEDFWAGEDETEENEDEQKEGDEDLDKTDKDQSKKNEGEKTEGHDNDENMEQKDDQQDQPKFPEDEEKRARQDEQFEDPETELEMEDETYGKNEPPEPEDLDLDDGMLGDDDDDMNDDKTDEQPEEDKRLPDFEDELVKENDDLKDQNNEDIDISNAGGNAGADEDKSKEEKNEESVDKNDENDVETKEKGDKVPDEDANKEQNSGHEEGGLIQNDESEQNEKDCDNDQENSHEKEKDESMITDENESAVEVDIIEDKQEDQDMENVETKNLQQEFAHNKDKKNKDKTLNALDAMDIDDKENKDIQSNIDQTDEENTKKDGKSIDMTELKNAITVDTEHVERNTETIFGHVQDELIVSSNQQSKNGANFEMMSLDQITPNENDAKHNPEDMKKWLKLCHDTCDLTQNLTEQLRLILEATKATRFKGDFKSGKRINMRKVIPFIASNYRKDKIWLRRTKPSKREYNIIVAVDDSTSMRENNVNELVDQSLAVLCQSLSSLEVGKFGLVKFGKEPEVIQSLQAKFSQDDGVRLLKACTYEQEATQFVKMLQVIDAMFKNNTGNSTSQLLLILSDGRGIYSEGKNKVLEQVRKLKLANVFIVFVIIETNNTDSVLDMKMMNVDEKGSIALVPYLEQFPFSFYLILKDIVNLPKSLSDSIRQWFELVSKS